MIKSASTWAVLMLLSIPVALHALQASAPTLIQGLTPLREEAAEADADLRKAASARADQMPGLKTALAAAAKEEADIRIAHNDKHEKGSPEFEKWNNLYIAAANRKNSIAERIQAMDQAYADAQKKKQAVVLKRQQLVRGILSALIQSHNTCAQTLTIDASDEALASCGRADFDGASKNLPPLHESQIKRDTYFKGSPSSPEVFDDSTPELRARKQQRIDAMIRVSSASETATATTVAPPAPGAPAPEPSLSDRLKEFLRNLRKK